MSVDGDRSIAISSWSCLVTVGQGTKIEAGQAEAGVS